MELVDNGLDIGTLIAEFGFPVIMAIGMGYFIYYIWAFISDNIQPELDAMHMALIKCIDQNRMLDNDMIRLDQKVNTILNMRESADYITQVWETIQKKGQQEQE